MSRPLPLLAVLFVLALPAIACAGSDRATAPGPRPELAVPAGVELQTAASVRLTPPSPAGEEGNIDEQIGEMYRRWQPTDFRPELKAKSLAPGIEPAFAFVRDRIAFEPYAGAFRGAGGTLAAGAGNADDRALLLAAMLNADGVATRFAFARLADDRAALLFERTFAPRAPAAAEPAASPQRAAFLGRLRSRAARDFAAITTALGDKLPRGAGVTRARALADIADHVWLQARVGDTWIDLDPAFADATVGRRYAEPARVADAFPQDRYQALTIRVATESLDGANLKREISLEVKRPVVDLADRQVFLVHMPEGGIAAVGRAGTGSDKDRFIPALWIGGEVMPGRPIAFASAAGGAAAGGGTGKVNNVLDAFGGGGGGAAASAPPQLVAEFLEFELNVPRRPPEVTRQALWDRGGAAWRLNAPLDPAKLRDLPRDDHGPFVAQTVHNVWVSAGGHDMASYASALTSLLISAGAPATAPAAGAGPGGGADPDFGEQAWPMAMTDFAWVLWGEQTFLPAINERPDRRFYLDSPRILLFSLRASSPRGAVGPIQLEQQVDLRRDVIRAIAKDSDADRDALARGKIWYASLEGALEHELPAQEAAQFINDARLESTSRLLDMNAAVVCVSDLAPGWESLAGPRETAARMREALAAGELLVVPRGVLQGGESGWWAVNAQTADTEPVLGAGFNGQKLGINGLNPRKPPPGPPKGQGNWPNNNGRGFKPTRTQAKSGGNEEGTLLVNISVPGAVMLGLEIAGFTVWVVVLIIRFFF